MGPNEVSGIPPPDVPAIALHSSTLQHSCLLLLLCTALQSCWELAAFWSPNDQVPAIEGNSTGEGRVWLQDVLNF